jgi:hypothetical protein
MAAKKAKKSEKAAIKRSAYFKVEGKMQSLSADTAPVWSGRFHG